MPASVVESFVLEFGLDTSKLTEGQRKLLESLHQIEDQALASGNRTEAGAKRMSDVLLQMKRQALELIGVFLGGRGIKEFIEYATNLDAATGRLAKTMGVSAQELSNWEIAFKEIGGSGESAVAALGGMNSEMVRFNLTGQSAMLPVLGRLGVSLYDNNNHLKTASELWIDASKAVKDFGMDSREATGFLSMLPGANQDMINFALLGPDAMRKYLTEAEKARKITEANVLAAQQFQKQLNLVESAAYGLADVFLQIVGPSITKVLNGLKEFFEGAQGNDTERAAPGARRLGQDVPRAWHEWLNNLGIIRNRGILRDDFSLSAQSGTSSRGSQNWANFLSGLSFLETSQKGGGNATTSAQGFFQFTKATAADATAAGIADPRTGSWEQQAAATMEFIKKFHPDAAKAIGAGQFEAAASLLKSRWPSLPGGSQPQSPSRYATWRQELTGGGPRPGAASVASMGGGGRNWDRTVNVTVGGVVVNAPNARDTPSSMNQVGPALNRAIVAAQANSGLDSGGP